VLIDENGEKKGLVSLDEGLEVAQEKSLDLVQVSPLNTNPVVCKLLDYGKHLFDKKKSKNLKSKEIQQKK
jgi:translation initiation factor IF-3